MYHLDHLFKHEGEELTIKMLDECVKDQKLENKLIINHNNNIIPTTKEVDLNNNEDNEEDSLEAHKTNYWNYRKRNIQRVYRMGKI